MLTYLQLTTKIKAKLWPSGEPLSLRAGHAAAFQEVMLELQKWVPCLKEWNTSTFETADRSWENAKTFVAAPFGQIRRVYTVAGGTDRWRDKVIYDSASWNEIECWARRLYQARTPVNSGLPVLPYGVKKEEADSDWAYGRARVGIWAIHRGNLYIAPWLQSTETLVVEWDGEKSSWQDSDVLNDSYWRQDVQGCIANFVAWQHEKFYGDKNLAPLFERDYLKDLANVMHWCRENTKKVAAVQCNPTGGGDGLVGDDLSGDDDDPTTPDTTEEDAVLFDYIGDTEETTEGQAIAAAIQSDNPEFLVLGGDIGYHADHGGYEAATASYAWAKTAGIIRPVLGNHEYDGDADLSEYFAFFANKLADAVPNQRYYEFVHGSVHGFVENRNAEETDGNDNDSTQAEWLFAKAFVSPARWKFAFGHQPPYSSDATYGSDTDLQRDYAGAGIQIVFSAHAHVAEHVIVDGVHYFTCGLGGRSRYSFGSAISGSQWRYNEKETRIRVTLDCDECLVEFVTSDGEVVYEYTVENPAA